MMKCNAIGLFRDIDELARAGLSTKYLDRAKDNLDAELEVPYDEGYSDGQITLCIHLRKKYFWDDEGWENDEVGG